MALKKPENKDDSHLIGWFFLLSKLTQYRIYQENFNKKKNSELLFWRFWIALSRIELEDKDLGSDGEGQESHEENGNS